MRRYMPLHVHVNGINSSAVLSQVLMWKCPTVYNAVRCVNGLLDRFLKSAWKTIRWCNFKLDRFTFQHAMLLFLYSLVMNPINRTCHSEVTIAICSTSWHATISVGAKPFEMTVWRTEYCVDDSQVLSDWQCQWGNGNKGKGFKPMLLVILGLVS